MEKVSTATTPVDVPCEEPEEDRGFALPPLPSLLTKPLGLEGWASLEPVILAALVTEEPLLLIGPHGAAKSFLLERLAQALALEYRFYNASLINYDDLVGIPVPDDERRHLRYISTPSAIWGAQIVFVDEISRTRPDLQNKLFPIIHEKRVQGIDLTELRYRWAAMNPPPTEDVSEEDADVYFGSEPLDPALADRFTFICEVPVWQDLTDEEKRCVLRDQFAGQHPFPVEPSLLVERARSFYERWKGDPPRALEDYLLVLLGALESQKVVCSTRRCTMLFRSILAVHSARIALYSFSWPDVPWQAIDWSTSALVAVKNGLPHAALGKRVQDDVLLGVHRQAWEVARLDEDNPWRILLTISDPWERCLTCLEMRDRLDDDHLSNLLLDCLASMDSLVERRCLAVASYLALHKTRRLRATVWESLAGLIRPVLFADAHTYHGERKVDIGDSLERSRCRSARDMAERIRGKKDRCYQDLLTANLILIFIPDNVYGSITPGQVSKKFSEIYKRALSDNRQ